MTEPKPPAARSLFDLWKITVCANCGSEFEQLKTAQKRTCRDCRRGNGR